MWRQYRKIEAGERILVAIDTASGGGDSTAGQFLSKTRVDVPLVWHSQTTTSDFIPELAIALARIHEVTGINPLVAFERQNGGAFLLDRLAALNYGGKWDIFKMPLFGRENNAEGTRLGWDTNTATRPKGLQELKDAVDHKIITVYDRPTLKEMLSFVTVRTSSAIKAQAERGGHDDLVMALMIVWQMYMIDATAPAEQSKRKKDYSKWENFRQEKTRDSRGFPILR